MIKSALINYSLKGFGATKPDPPSALTTSLRSTADKLLSMVLELVERTEYPQRDRLAAQIDGCRRDVIATEDPDAIERLTAECLAACQQVFAFVAAQRVSQQKEGASLIAVVRETIAAVSSDVDSLHRGVNESLERFDSVATVHDISEMKARLNVEVVSLKTVTADHYKWSQATIESLSERIAKLEHELLATQRAATVDALTGAANRGAFDATCDKWLKSGMLQFTLLLVDVDNLKHANDTHGHAAGDRVLQSVVTALKAGVRSNQDLVARFGGDEFAVLTLGLNLRQAENRFKAFAANLAKTSLLPDAGALAAVTVSCGVAEYSAGDTVKSLVQRADEALYEAKRRGKNCAVAKAKAHLKDL